MKRQGILIGLVASCALSSTAGATPILWNVSNVTFADGGTASGSFTFDATTATYSSWNISVAGGNTPGLPAYTYTSATGNVGINSDSMVDFLGSPLTRYLRLAFATPLTNAGGTVSLTPGASYECTNCSNLRNVLTGTVSTANAAVPEPATWAMMIAGFGLVGYAMRRRQHVRVSYAA